MIKILQIVMMFILLVGCNGNSEEIKKTNKVFYGPPSPVLTIDGVHIPSRLGTYSWFENDRGVSSDSVTPPELVNDLDPVIVKPEAKLHIDFSNKPLELGIGLWVNDHANYMKLDNPIFTLPKKAGVYIYVIFAEWQQGDASYVIKIQVE